MQKNKVIFYDVTDINECENSVVHYPCHFHAICHNEPGSYTCECNKGYSGNGILCDGIVHCHLIFKPYTHVNKLHLSRD